MILNYANTGRFEYTGTRDYTAFATFPAALSFVETYLGGMEGMRRHNESLLRAGSRLVCEKWNTFFVVRISTGTVILVAFAYFR